MGDADETYPIAELAPFVDRLAAGDDLVMGSRFEGTIHGEAMPWLNRHVGNPILTGMLNLFFGVKISDAHCGMRAVRRDALPVLDLHSTGMEFASEMVFKAFRRDLKVSEIPIDYYPRVGESKLNRFGDAWRHVKFMLLYSPSWLYFVPGLILLVLGVLGAIALAAGPVTIFGRPWQIHTLFACIAAILLGTQIVQLGVFARAFAASHLGETDRARRVGPRADQPRARPRARRDRAPRRPRDADGDLRRLGARRVRRALARVRHRDRVHARRGRGAGDPRVVLRQPPDDAHRRAVARDASSSTPRRVSGYVPLNERPHGGHARLLELALADHPQRVLDVGCSSGLPRRPLAERGRPGRRRRARPGRGEEARAVCEEVARRRRRDDGAAVRARVVRRRRSAAT